MISVLLDFKKAFDTVDHDILLGKLHKLGIRGVEHDWFRSYLYSREQYVDVGGVCSSKVTLGNCSVPQGSVIGPLLFLVYINDMKQCFLLYTMQMIPLYHCQEKTWLKLLI